MKAKGYFITGTDTGIGKTTVTQILMRNAKENRVAGMKPVASGCRITPQGLRNDDALALMGTATIALPYEKVNPYAFEPPIAPHIAAAEQGVSIDILRIQDFYRYIADRADTVYVEGVGGWLTPISDNQTMADVAESLQLPVILVVGIRLGCLNHALLTAAQIIKQGLPLAGWVANHIDPEMSRPKENLAYLTLAINAPLLGVIAHTEDPAHNENHIAVN